MALSNRQLGKDKVNERSILGGVGRLTLQTFPECEKMPLQNAEDVVMSPRVTALSEGNATSTSIQDMAECGFAAAQLHWAGRVCCQLAIDCSALGMGVATDRATMGSECPAERRRYLS